MDGDMDISVVVVIYTIVTVIGLLSLFLYLKRNKRPVQLSALHIIFTLAGFGVFTAYMVHTVPGQSLNWPSISYMLYGAAGVVTIVSVFTNKLMSRRQPLWMPAAYGAFEVLGYGALLATVAVLH